MENQLVNVTMLLVQNDIDPILAQQPAAIQSQFKERDLYLELTAYVLSRIPNLHCVHIGRQPFSLAKHLPQESAERQLCREKLITEGIYWAIEKSMQQHHDAGSKSASSSLHPPVAASHSS